MWQCLRKILAGLSDRFRGQKDNAPGAAEGVEAHPVLLITSAEVRSGLEASGLKKQFPGKFLSRAGGGGGKVAAVVYEITDWHSEIDGPWLDSLQIPVVVLTSERNLPLAETPLRRILKQPVAKEEILRALRDLGIRINEL